MILPNRFKTAGIMGRNTRLTPRLTRENTDFRVTFPHRALQPVQGDSGGHGIYQSDSAQKQGGADDGAVFDDQTELALKWTFSGMGREL